MPQYQYYCPKNDTTVQVRHCRKNSIQTWGRLCRKASGAIGDTPKDALVTQMQQLPCFCGTLYDAETCCKCVNSRHCSKLDKQTNT